LPAVSYGTVCVFNFFICICMVSFCLSNCIFAPNSVKSTIISSTSDNGGTFCISQISSVKIHAANMGNTAFFAPLIFTVPQSFSVGFMINFCMASPSFSSKNFVKIVCPTLQKYSHIKIKEYLRYIVIFF